MDFGALSRDLLGNAESLLRQWLPDGKKTGHEYVCGDLSGASGTSLSINLRTGKWSDFATGDAGGDLISLYAAIHRIDQGQAYRDLGGSVSDQRPARAPSSPPKPETPARVVVIPVPDSAGVPDFKHPKFGTPSSSWRYANQADQLLGFVCRYDPPGERKQIVPWTWDGNRWGMGQWNEPRPLYGLDLLNNDRPVMLVEGEKAAVAARKFAGNTYNVLTWSGGSQAIKKVDWSPLYGRKVLLWPDADQAGDKCMLDIGHTLLKGRCPEIKIIDVSGMPEKWDAADSGFSTFADFKSWAVPRVRMLDIPGPDPAPEPSNIKPAPAPDAVAWSPADWNSILQCTKSGPINNLDNVVRVIEHDPFLRGQIWYDEFLDRIVTNWQGPERNWKDSDDILLQLHMQRNIGLTKVGVNTCHDAAVVAAFHNIKNECKSYLDGLVWDGVERLKYLMTEGFDTEDTDYEAAVGRCWFVSMVARVFQPGCKVDTVPVLEGDQGRGKSTALSIIGGKWYCECHESVMSKDLFGVLDGHMLVEISEMHSFTRVEVERVKGIISCQVDRYRKSYGRNTEDHPRKTVLACTTNRDDWQRDETGARRFWPVTCGKINHQWLRDNRDHLFAEAVHRFKAGEAWWDVPVAEQQDAVEKRRDVDAWEAVIGDWLIGKMRVQTHEVLRDCLLIEVGRQDQLAQKRIARVMRVLGWKQRIVKEGNRNIRTYVRWE